MKLMDWVTDRTLPYLAAASACTAASSGYSRAGMKGRSRFYCALSVLWLGLTAYDIWSTHQEEAADAADATDGNDWEHWDESDLGTAVDRF
ncbi:hypothetical protein [Bifidobacterium criceti]|uniref:Uncharacterized protein n=1 Tax=Bifidobacterium criceti TaxID=1960969 RepID=A0A2A2EC88_9BIFI|nr:hypothetical protein [Bifidobacterium criceti]PAU66934.1 hypothetical protein B1526_1641 [Bifidobacterium criceti]